MIRTITFNLPDALYERLRQQAEKKRVSVEQELLEVVAQTVPISTDLTPELAEAVSSLRFLDDQALWQAAQSRLAPETAARVEELHLKRQREGLTEADSQTLSGLVQQYEKFMLVRARAAQLLKERGHDVNYGVLP